MSRSEVEELIGPPDETNVKVFGGAAGVERWTGLVWEYQWIVSNGKKRLEIVFTRPIATWEVDQWRWYDY